MILVGNRDQHRVSPRRVERGRGVLRGVGSVDAERGKRNSRRRGERRPGVNQGRFAIGGVRTKNGERSGIPCDRGRIRCCGVCYRRSTNDSSYS